MINYFPVLVSSSTCAATARKRSENDEADDDDDVVVADDDDDDDEYVPDGPAPHAKNSEVKRAAKNKSSHKKSAATKVRLDMSTTVQFHDSISLSIIFSRRSVGVVTFFLSDTTFSVTSMVTS